MKGYGQESTGVNTGEGIIGPEEPGKGLTVKLTNKLQFLPEFVPREHLTIKFI